MVKWSHITYPKKLGGLGLKNIYLFSLSLATRDLGNLSMSDELWGRDVKSKYILGITIEEWFITLNKPPVGSIVWKSLATSFPLVRLWMVWRIGNENFFE
jgi:hypothetical protein